MSAIAGNPEYWRAPPHRPLHPRVDAASRSPRSDSGSPRTERDQMRERRGLIMEKVAIDMAAWVKDARARGYEKVILVGWSGGGSLSLFYQAESEAPSVTATPAGDTVDLTRAGLEPADGVIFIAAHLSRAETLTEWLDPSVTDELDPDRRELEFDIYESACPHQPPYADEFVTRFRAARLRATAGSRRGARSGSRYCGGEGRVRSSAALSSIGRCATCGGSIRVSTRTDGDPAGVISAIRGPQTPRLRGWHAIRRCAHGCRNGATICRTRKGRRTRHASVARPSCRWRTKRMMPCPPRTIRR